MALQTIMQMPAIEYLQNTYEIPMEYLQNTYKISQALAVVLHVAWLWLCDCHQTQHSQIAERGFDPWAFGLRAQRANHCAVACILLNFGARSC